ncbi:MAG: VWA domain-containing protein [Lachnospiraceae bacterium]|nr:VWA domain-containing protein [Lachnospiraceae bacterium]
MRKLSKILALALSGAMLLTGCGSTIDTVRTSKVNTMTAEEAKTELNALVSQINVKTVENPTIDLSLEDTSVVDALADIDTFPMALEGTGSINIEIAAPSELCGGTPDDWLVVVGQKFNNSGVTVNGKSVSVSIRKISSGEVVTYVDAGAYKPDVYIPSNYALGKMLESSGVGITKLTDRIAGNTAGILMKKDIYDKVNEKYGEVNIKTVLEAANAKDLTFAYTNPYTSATGLNILTAMLAAFDPNDPLSSTASNALMEYQKTAPPVAYTTGVLRESARKGVVNAMVMEEQAYINTSELKDYVYTPVGIRHDHPVYVFDWTSNDKVEGTKAFIDFCLSDSMQKLATEKGFNRTETYKSQDAGLTGTQYLTAQSLWKENKTGGKPVIAVFITDVSGSMDGLPLNSLKESLINSSIYISENNYVGLVSYASDVTINLPIAQFDATQKAKFAGEVKGLSAVGGTATYDALCIGMDMIEKALEETPNAKPVIFLLTDGEQNEGYSLNRVTGVVSGMQIPVYSIAYNYGATDDLKTLSSINEATALNADTDDIVNQLRNLFNVNM